MVFESQIMVSQKLAAMALSMPFNPALLNKPDSAMVNNVEYQPHVCQRCFNASFLFWCASTSFWLFATFSSKAILV